VDNNSNIMGLQDRKAQVVIPNLDAVLEFQIQTANYSAEFGRNAGAVMNVSLKSGTNQLRGTVRWQGRSRRPAAEPVRLHARRPDSKEPDVLLCQLRENQHSTESSLVTVPTLLEREGIFDPQLTIRDPATGRPFPGNAIPRERWDPVSARLVSLWPEPNFQGATRANYISSPRHVRDREQYDLRADHNLSTRDKMFVRVSRMHFRRERQGPLPAPAVGGATNDVSRDVNDGLSLAASETHVFGSALVNETRLVSTA